MKINFMTLSSIITAGMLFTGCDLNVNNNSDDDINKFDVVKVNKKDYLLNKQNGNLYLIDKNTKEPLITKEYKDLILTEKGEIGPTKFNIKSKFLSKESKLIGDMIVLYNKENENTKVDIETWRDMLLEGNYRITLYFQDKDNFTISQKEVYLNKNFKYNSLDGYTIDLSGYLNVINNLDIKEINYSYVLPEYKDLNEKYLSKNGKTLTKECKKIEKELDIIANSIYVLDKNKVKNLNFVPQVEIANKLIKELNLYSKIQAKCISDISINRKLLGKVDYKQYAENAIKIKELEELEKKNNDMNKTSTK